MDSKKKMTNITEEEKQEILEYEALVKELTESFEEVFDDPEWHEYGPTGHPSEE